MNLIIYTDIGDDVDDLLAIRYANLSLQIDNILIILSSHEAEKRSAARERTSRYMTKKYTIIDGADPMCDLLVEKYINPSETYRVLCIGPMTECSRHIASGIIPVKTIQSFTVQAGFDAQISTIDENSRNTKIDRSAVGIILDSGVPISRIGKYAAYNIGLSKDRFIGLSISDQRRGKYILKEAYQWQDVFKKINLPVYERIYGKTPDILSYPYDLVALLSILYPEDFFWENNGHHKTVGYKPGVWFSDAVYKKLSVKKETEYSMHHSM